jgi:hypothetical protein
MQDYIEELSGEAPFYQYYMLEQLYFKALERQICNRKIAISLQFNYFDALIKLNQVLKWVKAQEKHIKLHFKVCCGNYSTVSSNTQDHLILFLG